MRSAPYLLLLLLFSCSNQPNEKPQARIDSAQNRETIITEKVEQDTLRAGSQPFALVTSCPLIKDSANFIKQLKDVLRAKQRYFPDQPFSERITYYKKITLNGSNKKYFLCEYNYGDGSNAAFPWQYQLLFDNNGKLVEILNASRFELFNVFPGQRPFLLTVLSTSRGNGGHQLFKISADTLENVYEGYTDYQTKTYDACEDNAVFEHDELKVRVKDVNADGYNDLTFSGKMLLIQGLTKDSTWYDFEIRGKDTISYSADHPFKTLPVKYVFLYDARTKHFVESAKYSIKNPFW